MKGDRGGGIAAWLRDGVRGTHELPGTQISLPHSSPALWHPGLDLQTMMASTALTNPGAQGWKKTRILQDCP